MNSYEYMLIKHFWNHCYKIEKLIIDIKNIYFENELLNNLIYILKQFDIIII